MKTFNIPENQVYVPEIRFVDIDAGGIVNNAVYFNYFEQSRIHFFESLLGTKWDWNSAGMVVARHEIDYRAPILFNDEVRIVTWIEHVGSKSMTACYDILKYQGSQWAVIASAKTVLVSYNHRKHCTEPWHHQIVEAVRQFGSEKPNLWGE